MLGVCGWRMTGQRIIMAFHGLQACSHAQQSKDAQLFWIGFNMLWAGLLIYFEDVRDERLPQSTVC
jgi:hypothetical protein